MTESCKVNKAPDRSAPLSGSKKVFLAGSIEMGKAEDWQEKVTKHLSDVCSKHDVKVTIYNPRRDDWDSSWEQDINNTQFFDQVSWELDHIEKSDIVIVYFDKATVSPITLLELGKVLESSTIPVVYCPEGFARKGNVDIACYRKDVPVFTEMDKFLEELNSRLGVKETTTDKEPEKEESAKEESGESKEEIKESVELENTVILKSFFDAPSVEYAIGEENTIVVEDFQHIENSCMMGSWKFMGREMYSGICNENGSTKITMNIKNPITQEERIVEFKLQKADENNPEKVILVD